MVEHGIGERNTAFDVQGNRVEEVFVTRHVRGWHRFARMVDFIFHVFLLQELRLSVGTTLPQHRQQFLLVFRLMSTEVLHPPGHFHVTLLIPVAFVFAGIHRRSLDCWPERMHSLLLLQQTIDRDTSTFERLQRRRQLVTDRVNGCLQRFAKDESRQLTGDVDVIEFADLFLEVQDHFVLLVFQGAGTAVVRLEEQPE